MPLRNAPSVLRGRLGTKVDLGRLGVGDVERGDELADGRLLAQCGGVDAARSRLVAERLGVECRALRLELLHLGRRAGRATLEVRLGLPGCPEVAPEFLDLSLTVEREHGEAGVLLLAAALLGNRLLQRLDALQP